MPPFGIKKKIKNKNALLSISIDYNFIISITTDANMLKMLKIT